MGADNHLTVDMSDDSDTETVHVVTERPFERHAVTRVRKVFEDEQDAIQFKESKNGPFKSMSVMEHEVK